jgi:vacuolar-type H+-ATPase subunit E/Vma4
MAKEKSPYHQLLIDNGLTAEPLKIVLDAHESAIKAVTDSTQEEITKLKAEKSFLEEKVAALSEKVEQTERVTPGTYPAKNKKIYKFQNGTLEFVYARNGSAAQKFVTKEAINDAALMEELISIGAGFIEEVESENPKNHVNSSI